jgi:AP2-associated kinase
MPEPTSSESATTNITSDVDFLKAREEEEKERKHHHKRMSSGSRHMKRTSLPSINLGGTTKLLAGKFGDAFKKFESNESNDQQERSPSPSRQPATALTPIAGSEATDLSDERQYMDETEELSPEMRRELEKRNLEAEERRVANAAAEYKQRLAGRAGGGGGGGGGSVKATSIQNRVQSLLNKNSRPAQKTATGYGHFTESPASIAPQQTQPTQYQTEGGQGISKVMSAPASALTSRTDLRSHRPVAPPKPKILRTAVIEPVGTSSSVTAGDEDWESSFAAKYPSLAGLEMVETSIDAAPTKSAATLRTKEV